MKRSILFLLSCYFAFLIYQVFSFNFVLTDDADMLWFRPTSGWIFRHWHKQGRGLTGWLESWLYLKAGSMTGLRCIRLLTVAGWVLVLWQLSRLLKGMPGWLTICYFTVSFFALISIAWTVCVVLPFACMAALGGGYALGLAGSAAGMGRRLIWGVVFVLLSLVSLFLYQTCYPFVLLPLYLRFLEAKDGRWTRSMVMGLIAFFAVLGLYYGLFRLGLHLTGDMPSSRTALRFNPLDRLGFFFSYPMNQAFLACFFFDTRSIICQCVFPLLLPGWFLFVAYRQRGAVKSKFLYVLGMFGWWILGYLPQLIAQENDAAYRTMGVLGLMVFMMMADVVVSFVSRQWVVVVLSAAMLCRGGMIYYFYVSRPLSVEFAALQAAVRKGYHPGIKRVNFVLADVDGFNERFNIRHYKDEFGMPSTHKDWTPEPLVRLMVAEMTGDTVAAAGLKVVITERPEQVPAADEMVIDATRLW